MPEDPREKERDGDWPSGPWKGFWTEPNRPYFPFKNRMELDLYFESGIITGSGDDPIGPFTIRGSYDTKEGKCTWLKRYLRHSVNYDGVRDGKGIYGSWELIEQGFRRAYRSTGGFHIWPKGIAEHEIAKAEAEMGQPNAAAPEIPVPGKAKVPARL